LYEYRYVWAKRRYSVARQGFGVVVEGHDWLWVTGLAEVAGGADMLCPADRPHFEEGRRRELSRE
jgi:hypothetical protein